MLKKNYLDRSDKPESVDEATLKRIFGEGLARLSPEEKSIILEALREARQRRKSLLFA